MILFLWQGTGNILEENEYSQIPHIHSLSRKIIFSCLIPTSSGYTHLCDIYSLTQKI